MSQSYPVFIEETNLRLVWIDADNAEQARRRAQEEPWRYGKDDEPCNGWHSVYAPQPDGPYGWDAVYAAYSGAADEPDQHVQLHRAEMRRRELVARQAACHEARHPDVTVYCAEYLFIAASERAS